MPKAVWLWLGVACAVVCSAAQSGEKAPRKSNKFADRPEVNQQDITPAVEVPKTGRPDPKCPHPMSILWSREVEASVYATPILADLDGNGEKELIVNTYAQFIDVLDTHNGLSKAGWPFSMPDAAFHSSPLVADVDGDGTVEVVSVTFDGEVLVLGKHGTPRLQDIVKVPKLKVRRDWYASRTRGDQRGDDSHFAEPSKAEYQHTLERLVRTSHSHSAPILPFSDNDEPATVQLPFSEDGVESFRELFMEELVGDKPEHKVLLGDDDFVHVDSHVICSPAISDLNNDGRQDLVIPVSYFFDRETFNYGDVGSLDIDLTKYIAGGVVAIDLMDGHVLWQTQLDLTTEADDQRSFMYSSPTIADLEGDGTMEVVVGTSKGLVYVLSSTGEIREGFPVEMAEIQGQVALADVNGDGRLDIIVADGNSNLAVFDCEGNELWETRLGGLSAHGPMLADVDGDGVLDIVLTTSLGFVYAVSQEDGSAKPNFPVKIGQRVISPVLPIRTSNKHQHHSLIVPAFDGHVYVIDGNDGCISSVDLGEHSYTMVLADDLTGSNTMELIVTTMNGMVYCLSTKIPYTPLRAWGSQNQLLNGFAPREGNVGVRVSDLTREHDHITGSQFPITFEIVDDRPPLKLEPLFQAVPYTVRIWLGQMELYAGEFAAKGEHVAIVQAPSARMSGVVRVELRDRHNVRYVDTFSVSFNEHFYKTMKWVLVVPFLLMSTALVFVKELKTPLPLY